MSTPLTPLVSRTAADLRRAFLDFFVARGHTLVPSAPLVPNDPTLLFTTAGMVQFKPYYTASGDVPYGGRAVSVQKCLRLTDLENVGMTPRHDTFFEMLGNFSFGDRKKGAYFKEEAIAFAWEFVTEELKLPVARLYASIFAGEGKLPRDDEAAALWKKVGLPANHIVALGRADNFWGPAGGQGACGPCSEIYFDLGESRPGYLAPGAFWGERPGDAGDRYMEFWNLVFPQFDAAADGTLTPLARPGIDTGMGVERLAMIMQGKNTIFETDLFAPLIERIASLARPVEAETHGGPLASRIIADHVRALTFAIAEGALPGNEGAGYVLRRLLRRAIRRGRSDDGLCLMSPFLAEAGDAVVQVFGSHYTELVQRREAIRTVLQREEEVFVATYEDGLARLEYLLERAEGRGLGGQDAFALHDTYGFPIELTEEIAAERGVRVDRTGFDRAMEAQRERARAASKFAKTGGEATAPWTEASAGPDSEFLGYERVSADRVRVRRWRAVEDGLELVLDQTPFYAESGGQVADHGTLAAGSQAVPVTHVFRERDSIVHRIRLGGSPAAWLEAAQAGFTAQVDSERRRPTQRHHTATHLLHAALRTVLGTHVRQAGSLVAPDRLRFDYTHFEAPQPEQTARIERMVADWVLCNTSVSWQILPLEEAKALGAMALFGEKYGAQVRVVTVAGVEEAGIPTSRELCGGTHVERTGDIGAFVLVADSAIASGVRRVEALCGQVALAWLKAQAETLARAAAIFQVRPEAVPGQIEKLKADLELARRTQAEAQKGGLEAEMVEAAQGATSAPAGKWLVHRLKTEGDVNAARDAADKLRGALGRGAAVLAIAASGKVTLLAAVTDDLVSEKKLNASDLVKKVAQVAGGSGGGKPHLALAGAKDPSKVGAALDEARRLLKEALGG